MSDGIVQIETPFQFNEENQREFDDLIGRYPVKEAAMLPTLHLAQRQAGYISPCCHEVCSGIVGTFRDEGKRRGDLLSNVL